MAAALQTPEIGPGTPTGEKLRCAYLCYERLHFYDTYILSVLVPTYYKPSKRTLGAARYLNQQYKKHLENPKSRPWWKMSFLFGGGRPQPSSAEKIAAAEQEIEMVSDMFNR
jgi:hypothetical protein